MVPANGGAVGQEHTRKTCQCCGRDATNGKSYLQSGEFTHYCGLRCLQIDQLGGRVTK